MCGIAGFSGTNTIQNLLLANQRQRHRGPDDEGYYFDSDKHIGLAHTRLSILDLSHLGHQPMISQDERFILTYNGEIYNFPQLRQELTEQNVSFVSNSDTEVLLALYERIGVKMLDKLNGIFAFAVFDQETEELFIAKDRWGIKPLYYSANDECFCFASEIKALLAFIPSEHKLDSDAFVRYLSHLWCPGDATPLRNVRKLKPGHAVLVKGGRAEKIWQWSALPKAPHVAVDITPQAAAEKTEVLLRQAVNRQMLSDAPVGSFLSGGVDSSAIALFAKEIDPNLQCFTIEMSGGNERGFSDDLPYAREVADLLNLDLQVVTVDTSTLANDVEKMVNSLDEPLADPAALNVLYISELAKKNGVKVLLSGTGGDDLFTGYRRHIAVDLEKYWAWLPKPARMALEWLSTSLPVKHPSIRRFAKVMSGASLPQDERLLNYYKWNAQFDVLECLSSEFRSTVQDVSGSTPMCDYLDDFGWHADPLINMLSLEQRFFLADHNLIYTDKMSMATGVEIRVPFLDDDLADFAATLPKQVRQKDGTGKWVLKKMLEAYLPSHIVHRPKTGFGVPLRRWMTGELSELVGDHLSESQINKHGVFDARAVQRLEQLNKSGKMDASYTLFSILCFQIWLERYRPIST